MAITKSGEKAKQSRLVSINFNPRTIIRDRRLSTPADSELQQSNIANYTTSEPASSRKKRKSNGPALVVRDTYSEDDEEANDGLFLKADSEGSDGHDEREADESYRPAKRKRSGRSVSSSKSRRQQREPEVKDTSTLTQAHGFECIPSTLSDSEGDAHQPSTTQKAKTRKKRKKKEDEDAEVVDKNTLTQAYGFERVYPSFAESGADEEEQQEHEIEEKKEDEDNRFEAHTQAPYTPKKCGIPFEIPSSYTPPVTPLSPYVDNEKAIAQELARSPLKSLQKKMSEGLMLPPKTKRLVRDPGILTPTSDKKTSAVEDPFAPSEVKNGLLAQEGGEIGSTRTAAPTPSEPRKEDVEKRDSPINDKEATNDLVGPGPPQLSSLQSVENDEEADVDATSSLKLKDRIVQSSQWWENSISEPSLQQTYQQVLIVEDSQSQGDSLDEAAEAFASLDGTDERSERSPEASVALMLRSISEGSVEASDAIDVKNTSTYLGNIEQSSKSGFKSDDEEESLGQKEVINEEEGLQHEKEDVDLNDSPSLVHERHETQDGKENLQDSLKSNAQCSTKDPREHQLNYEFERHMHDVSGDCSINPADEDELYLEQEHKTLLSADYVDMMAEPQDVQISSIESEAENLSLENEANNFELHSASYIQVPSSQPDLYASHRSSPPGETHTQYKRNIEVLNAPVLDYKYDSNPATLKEPMMQQLPLVQLSDDEEHDNDTSFSQIWTSSPSSAIAPTKRYVKEDLEAWKLEKFGPTQPVPTISQILPASMLLESILTAEDDEPRTRPGSYDDEEDELLFML